MTKDPTVSSTSSNIHDDSVGNSVFLTGGSRSGGEGEVNVTSAKTMASLISAKGGRFSGKLNKDSPRVSLCAMRLTNPMTHCVTRNDAVYGNLLFLFSFSRATFFVPFSRSPRSLFVRRQCVTVLFIHRHFRPRISAVLTRRGVTVNRAALKTRARGLRREMEI